MINYHVSQFLFVIFIKKVISDFYQRWNRILFYFIFTFTCANLL